MQEEGGQLQPDGAHPGLGGHGVAAAGSLAPACLHYHSPPDNHHLGAWPGDVGPIDSEGGAAGGDGHHAAHPEPGQ